MTTARWGGYDVPLLERPLHYLSEVERLVSGPLDPEREEWRASRHRYVEDRGRIHKVKAVQGASFLTGTQTEVIYSNQTAGAAQTGTTEFWVNTEAAMGTQAKVPSAVWYANAQRTATIRVVARGILTTTTGPPTQTFTTRLGGATHGVSTTGPIIGGTAAITCTVSLTNQIWEMEFDVQMVTMAAAGASSTVRGLGLLASPALASPFSYAVFGGAASPGTVATVDPTIDNFVSFNCASSSASNSVTLLQLIILGLN